MNMVVTRSTPLVRVRPNLRWQDVKLRRHLWGLPNSQWQENNRSEPTSKSEESDSSKSQAASGRQSLNEEQQKFLDSAVSFISIRLELFGST